MLYLIGGPARSGKSLLARRMLRRRQTPYFCADYLTSGLEAGAPGLGVRHEHPSRERGERLWPVLAGVLRNLVEVEPEYLVEGDALLPDRVASLRAGYGGQIRTCFLGYTACSLDAKLAAIRSHPSPVNDWVAGMSDADLRELVAEMVAYSRFLESECRKHDIAYFDGSQDFMVALERAEAYLVGAVYLSRP